MTKQKVLYVLPEYDPETPSHLRHIFDLLEGASPSLDIVLLIERAHATPTIKGIRTTYVQRFTTAPFNLI